MTPTRADTLAFATFALALLAAAPASAQITATVTTTLTDPTTNLPVATAVPGQIVRMRTIVSWTPQGTQFAGIAGSFYCNPDNPDGDPGVASARFSDYASGGLVTLGVLENTDDIIGINIAQTPAFFTGGFLVPPSANWMGITIAGYNWEAPSTPGLYNFAFQFSPIAPNVRIYPSTSSPQFVEAPTTVVGATLLVIPSPSAALAFVLAPMLIAHRRRSPQ